MSDLVAIILAAFAALLPPVAEPKPAPSVPSEAQWRTLRECESAGDYSIVDDSGLYRGAYQFDLGTWSSVGGTGDPAAASPAEQDRRAVKLWHARAWQPWPVCGPLARDAGK